MRPAAKIGIALLLVAVVVTASVVDWSALAPSEPATLTPPEPPVEELPEGVCYAGEWVGCWRFQDDPTGTRFLKVANDGCSMELSGFADGHIVYGFTIDEMEAFGPLGRQFNAPRGSVVFYLVYKGMGYDADPVMAVDSRRGEDGRIPYLSGMYSGWAILTRSAATGLRTMAVVTRDEQAHLAPEDQPKINEYRLLPMVCP